MIVLLSAISAQADISGIVFRDFNLNGVKDTLEPGVAGLTVAAYDDSGQAVDTVMTNSDGNYTLATDPGTYRVEVSGVPAFLKPGTSLSGNTRPLVDRVTDGATHNVGLISAGEYCQSNPDILVTRFTKYNRDGSNGQISVFLEYAYTANTTDDDSTDDPKAELGTYSQIGSIYGLAHFKEANITYLGTYLKRHADIGPSGMGAIYKYDHASGTFSTLITLPTYDPRNGAGQGYDWDHDTEAYRWVGKTGIGDIEISEDEQRLFAVDLYDRKLYVIDLNQSGDATGHTGYDIPNPCGNDTDFRPMALGYRDGKLYVGVTCTAESTVDPDNQDDSTNGPRKGDRNALSAHIYRFDPDSTSFEPNAVLDINLTYDRGCIHSSDVSNQDPSTCTYQDWDDQTQPYRANWNPWQMDYDIVFNDKKPGDIGNQDNWIEYMQPLLSDIVFDNDGSMIIQIRDVNGDRGGYKNYSPNPNDTTRQNMNGEGDILRACGNPQSGWTLENNGECGGVQTNGANNHEGPGGGEYYWNDQGPGGTNHSTAGSAYQGDAGHSDTSMGGLLVVPGYPDVVTGLMDVTDYLNNGLGWLRNDTGELAKDGSGNPKRLLVSEDDQDKFYGKGSGIGDLEALCDPAPIEIGNYVWEDSDGDGIQDPGESPIANVTVKLYDANGQEIGSTTTDSNGEYYFGGASNARGVALAPHTHYQIRIALNDQHLNGRVPTTRDANPSAPDSDDQHDSDGDNGTLNPGFSTIDYTTGGAGKNDHTLDFGFVPPSSLGDYVWVDSNRDGIQNDGANAGIQGVTVHLYKDGQDTGRTATTDGNGKYLFDNLVPGSYHVKFDVPNGYVVSPKDQGNDETKDSDADPATGATVDTDLSAGENDLTWDMGIYPVADVSLSKDVNQSTAYEGNRVTFTITVHNDGPSVAHNVTVTDAVPDGYENVGDATNGASVSGSTVSFTVASLAVGADASFSFQADYKESGEHTNWAEVTAMDEADVDSDPASDHTQDDLNDGQPDDDESNATVSTGEKATLGDYVWVDSNRDGIQNDGANAGIQGVTVHLYKDGQDTGRTATTDSNGKYLFDNLVPGSYHVKFDVPNGYVVSPKDQGNDETKDSDADPATGATVDTDLSAGENDLTWDMGIYPVASQTASIGDYVWMDDNMNGLQDDNHPMSGVHVVLHRADGSVVAETDTNSSGQYYFGNLEAGDYYVSFDDQYYYTDPNVGSDDTIDSDVNRSTFRTETTHLDWGERDMTIDAGITPTAHIGDYFWIDENKNGIQDPGEPPVAGGGCRAL
ncbi:SdrD B-like domain-containing protein [Nitratifractor salsuginis]|uniref:SdrD B-like domain-containing protein n=1 Tax=Nitratifractor salsuginis TaxID=269261 RepID=UPI00145DD61A|nr:SdrD B-like domain-containing protein [Nitratifractor salsuginis]